VQALPNAASTGLLSQMGASRLRRIQLNIFMPLLVFSIGVPSLVTPYPSQAASNGATIQRVPITTTAPTPGATSYDATEGTIQ
jgi:hypothetical protein